jgi:hypothetical protein
MARGDRNSKVVYALAGVMVGAIFTRIFALLKQQAARSADRERMGARLKQVTAEKVMTAQP